MIGERRLVAIRYAPVFEAVSKSKRSCRCGTTVDRSRHRAAAFEAWRLVFGVRCSNACRSMPQNATAIREPYDGDCTQWSGSFLSPSTLERYTFSFRGTVAATIICLVFERLQVRCHKMRRPFANRTMATALNGRVHSSRPSTLDRYTFSFRGTVAATKRCPLLPTLYLIIAAAANT